MSNSRFVRVLAVAASVALCLTACARNEGQDSTTPESDVAVIEPGYFPQPDGGSPVSGGTLTFAEWTESRSLDPTMTMSTAQSGGNLMVAIYDQLVRFDATTGELQPRMAESVTPNDDYTEWTIALRPGIEFSDGTPLNADAVVGSMNYFMSSHGFDVGLVGALWGGVEKVDDLTVRVTLTDSWAGFDAVLARSLGFIVAPAAIEDGDENFTPIGAGAFTFESYRPAEDLVLSANSNHWDGEPHLENLRFVFMPAELTRYESFDTGAIQAAFLADHELVGDIVDRDLPRTTYIANSGEFVLINGADGNSTSDPRVRKALALATDPQVINDRAWGGDALAGKSLFAPVSKWYDATVEVNPYDPEAAAQLVEDAKADGFDGKIEILNTDVPARREVVMTLKAQWEAVGFEVEIDNVRTGADIVSRVYVDRSFNVAYTGLQTLDANPYTNLFETFHSKSGANVLGYQSPQFDALLEELRATPLEDAQDVLSRISAQYQEDVPGLVLGHLAPTTFWQDEVHGIQPLNDGMVDFGKTWIKQ